MGSQKCPQHPSTQPYLRSGRQHANTALLGQSLLQRHADINKSYETQRQAKKLLAPKEEHTLCRKGTAYVHILRGHRFQGVVDVPFVLHVLAVAAPTPEVGLHLREDLLDLHSNVHERAVVLRNTEVRARKLLLHSRSITVTCNWCPKHRHGT